MRLIDLRHRVPTLLKAAFPGLLWNVTARSESTKLPSEKALYLTFDDGPVPGPTEYVLDVLARYGIHGAFFAVGDNIDKHPEVARRIVAEGHTLANHTYHHVKGWERSLEEYEEEVERCNTALVRVGAGHPAHAHPLFRPPYGRITPAQARHLVHGHRIVMWSVLSADYDKDLSVSDCLVNTFCALHDGAIIVFHDSQKAFGRLEAVLPAFIEAARFDGWAFGRLS